MSTRADYQEGDDEVAEWLGLHHKLHFDSLTDEQREHWRGRFDEAHEGNGGETNAEFVDRLMNMSKAGPLMQIFVIQALDQYSKVVAAADPDQLLSSPLVSPAAWHRCAVELQAELKKRLD